MRALAAFWLKIFGILKRMGSACLSTIAHLFTQWFRSCKQIWSEAAAAMCFLHGEQFRYLEGLSLTSLVAQLGSTFGFHLYSYAFRDRS